MKIYAMIPCRLGSKRIPKKNLRLLGDKTLSQWVASTVKETDLFDEIYINSEADIFEKVAQQVGVKYYKRPEQYATDTATNDEFALDFINAFEFDVLVQINPTSPFLSKEDIINFISEFKSKNLQTLHTVKNEKIDFVVVNGENAADNGLGLTQEICKDFFNSGVDVITTGNHVWDQKETMSYIEKENRLLRPKNLFEPSPGKGFEIFTAKNGMKVGVLNLMGNVFMKKCDDVFETAQKFINDYKLKKDYDFLIVDFHGEITSEKNAIGHYFDGKATLLVGTHTHIPTNDARVLENGTAYQTDAGMCGDYDSVIGMNKDNSLNRFMKKDSIKHFPAKGEATLCGVIVDCNVKTGLANKVESYIFGGELNNSH